MINISFRYEEDGNADSSHEELRRSLSLAKLLSY